MRTLSCLVALALFGCDTDASPSPSPELAPVAPEAPPEVAAERSRLAAIADEAMSLDADALLDRFAVPHVDGLGYDPLDAQNLEIVQASPFALDDDELALLEKNGFVISARKPLGTFLTGYELIYNADLPVYISADSLLHAIHRAYSDLLKTTESQALYPALEGLLKRLHDRLASGAADAWGPEAVADLDAYLTVARSLLAWEPVAPQAGGDPDWVTRQYQSALAAEGLGDAKFFGVPRTVDWSQFGPRGHYAGEPALEHYFRAMMWLGRVDLRMVETDAFGNTHLNRRATRVVLALNDLLDKSARQDWDRMEAVLQSFVGRQDFVTVDALPKLADALGAADAASLAALEDTDLLRVLQSSTFDVQRIRGQFIEGGFEKETPLAISATLFGQRYIVDSEVLSNVVWDTVRSGRMMPDPLDAAFAAMGNDQAAALLEPQLREFDDYPGRLAAMRALIDDRPAAEWTGDLYSNWMSLLRTLSPDPDVVADPAAAGLPAVWGTEAWGRRLLNTQLGSWTELRHDNLLYAKPSYTGGGGCDYPDGYVEPVPAFYARLMVMAERGQAIADGPLAELAPGVANNIRNWWTHLHEVASKLKDLADQQITGVPFDEDQVRWLEQAVDIAPDDYMGYVVGGWYGQLLRLSGEDDPYEQDLVVVDIHTQPETLAGEVVGRVLHMGTGDVRLMVTTVESCMGPRAYAGPVYATHSFITKDFERLTDDDWADRLRATAPEELPWMKDLVVR